MNVKLVDSIFSTVFYSKLNSKESRKCVSHINPKLIAFSTQYAALLLLLLSSETRRQIREHICNCLIIWKSRAHKKKFINGCRKIRRKIKYLLLLPSV